MINYASSSEFYTVLIIFDWLYLVIFHFCLIRFSWNIAVDKYKFRESVEIFRKILWLVTILSLCHWIAAEFTTFWSYLHSLLSGPTLVILKGQKIKHMFIYLSLICFCSCVFSLFRTCTCSLCYHVKFKHVCPVKILPSIAKHNIGSISHSRHNIWCGIAGI